MNINDMYRVGVILAAGLGSRMNLHEPRSIIKPLVKLNNSDLLMMTVNSIEKAGCSEIIIVLGWRAKEVQSYIERVYKGKTKLRFVYNADYELSNGLSVLCAKKIVHGEFVLTMADHVLDDQIMMMVRNHRPLESGAVLCVDYKIDSIFDLDDATKVLESEGKIKKIGKELEVFNCIDTGVFICTPDLMQALEEIYLLNGDVSLTEAIQLLAKRSEMSVLDIGDAFWQDIDTVEMLDHARHMLRKKL